MIATFTRADVALFRRLFGQARPYWPHLAAIFLLDLVATPLALLGPVPLKIAVDNIVGSEPLPGFVRALLPWTGPDSTLALLILAAGLQIAVLLLGQLRDLAVYVLRARAGLGVTLGFRARLFRHAQRLSLVFHDRRGTADSVYRIQWDAPGIQWVTIDGVIHPGVTNIGLRPTFEDATRPTIEVHVLGLDRDLYGSTIRLGFVQRLRDERRFPDVDALKAQIDADVRRARRLFDRLSV